MRRAAAAGRRSRPIRRSRPVRSHAPAFDERCSALVESHAADAAGHARPARPGLVPRARRRGRLRADARSQAAARHRGRARAIRPACWPRRWAAWARSSRSIRRRAPISRACRGVQVVPSTVQAAPMRAVRPAWRRRRAVHRFQPHPDAGQRRRPAAQPRAAAPAGRRDRAHPRYLPAVRLSAGLGLARLQRTAGRAAAADAPAPMRPCSPASGRASASPTDLRSRSWPACRCRRARCRPACGSRSAAISTAGACLALSPIGAYVFWPNELRVARSAIVGNNYDIILIGLVAVFLILRLRSVLGKRTGNERPPARDPFAPPPPPPPPASPPRMPARRRATTMWFPCRTAARRRDRAGGNAPGGIRSTVLPTPRRASRRSAAPIRAFEPIGSPPAPVPPSPPSSRPSPRATPLR